MARNTWPLAGVVLLLLAGCTDSSPQETLEAADGAEGGGLPGSGTPPSGAAGVGDLVVWVRDPDLHPLAGATVNVENRTLASDASGRALFGGLAAGFTLVEAVMEGYRSAQAGIDVVAGATVDAEVKLLPGDELSAPPPPVADPEEGPHPYVEEFAFEGFYDCSATYLIVTGDCLLIVDTPLSEAGVPVQAGDLTNEQYVFEFPLDYGWKSVVAQMYWEKTTLAGDKMTLAVEPAEAPEDGHAAKYARAEGSSPLTIRLDAGVPHANATASADGEQPDMPNANGGEVLRTRSYVQGELHRPAGTQFLGVGAAIQQQFNVYVTVFYVEPAPEGYTIADKET